MPLDLGSLELYMGPAALGGPDDLEGPIVAFIDGANEHLDVAVQELESLPIAKALLRAKARDVDVRVILEGKYLTVRTPVADPWSPGGANEKNREIHSALLRAGIDVISDLNPETFHQKFIVRDPEGSKAGLLTGSTNFTPTGTSKNLNHVVVLKSKRVTELYLDEFEEAWSGTFGQKNERHDPAPKCYDVSKVRVKVLFAPDHTPELEIMKQMLNAKSRVDFAMFTFAESSGIDDTMICLHRSGIPVRGVLDRSQANQSWAATRPIANAGAELWQPKTGLGIGKLHHKLLVVDRNVTVVGSFNYTGTANALNDENILVIGDPREKDADAKARQRQIADFARKEIDRIIADQSERIPAS